MRIEQSQGGSLSRLCLLSGYSRQGYYKQHRNKERKMLQYDLIIQKVIDYRVIQKRIGARKLLHLLQPFIKLHSIVMGRDALFELLGAHNLLIRRKRYNKPKTTFSSHWLRKYPNLIQELTLSFPEELWVSDITYIALYDDEAYLSLITDAYSRKIVGFHLSKSLGAEGCVMALKMAISGCENTEGLIHHSDRGVQYCCNDYVNLLKSYKIEISMTQTGNPRDNAIAERVNGILKIELLENEFKDLASARLAVANAINTYNYLRPHSSISMLTPALAHSTSGELKRKWKNYYKTKLNKEVTIEK